MSIFQQKILISLGLFLLFTFAVAVYVMPAKQLPKIPMRILAPTSTPIPTPTPEPPFTTYQLPVIQKKDFYTIVMVGDSMTAILGPHGGTLSEYLNQLYQSTPGHQKILIDNYAQGATSIIDLPKQMTSKTTIGDVTLDPLLSRQFDLILIESFGYNPLSQFSLNDGLLRQTQTLEQTMKILIKQHPQSAVLFVATIAPNKETYALQVLPQLSSADRALEAGERISYIQNHIAFAKTHTIPLIDIFDNSLTPDGDGNLSYINLGDHIHPSFAGVDFIDHQIGDYIYNNKILPTN